MNPQLGLIDWLGFFGSFALVIALIAGLFWLLNALNGRRLGQPAERALAIAATLSIGPRQRLVLVRARNREILLGVSLQQISRLGSWPAPGGAADTGQAASQGAAAPPAPKRLLGQRQENS